MGDKNPNITVVVRVRPPRKEELAQNGLSIIKVVDEHCISLELSTEDVNRGLKKRILPIKESVFTFDRVFGEESTSAQVYAATTQLLLDQVLNGFNCTCFAYGATGSGKTHTMIGNSNNPGVMVITMNDLFKRMEDSPERNYDIKISYLEVYNESIRDLLVEDSSHLILRDNDGKNVVVAGLSQHEPKSAEEVFQLLERGNMRRSQSATGANAQSSRSHAILQAVICSKTREGEASVTRRAKLSLIDLAGSERAAKTRNSGARLTEGANINRSLLALGNCINALGQGHRTAHIPYRNSKLTRLLKDSLGGNCKTVMIANISPSVTTYEDSHNTLQYADRAKRIRTKVRRNEATTAGHIPQYRGLVQELRAEIAQLKSRDETTLSQKFRQDIHTLQAEVLSLETALQELHAREMANLAAHLPVDTSFTRNRIWGDASALELKISALLGAIQSSALSFQEKEESGRHLAFTLHRIKTALECYTKDVTIHNFTRRTTLLEEDLHTSQRFLYQLQEILHSHSLLTEELTLQFNQLQTPSERWNTNEHTAPLLPFEDNEEAPQSEAPPLPGTPCMSPISSALLSPPLPQFSYPLIRLKGHTPKQTRFASPDSLVSYPTPVQIPPTQPSIPRGILRASDRRESFAKPDNNQTERTAPVARRVKPTSQHERLQTPYKSVYHSPFHHEKTNRSVAFVYRAKPLAPLFENNQNEF